MAGLLDDLRQQLTAGDAVFVVGSGVTRAATNDAPAASWKGLLRTGVQYVRDLGTTKTEHWDRMVSGMLDSGDPTFYIHAAEIITEALGGRSGAEYETWLEETIGQLQVVDPAILDTLCAFNAPMLTTNYDGLLEQATKRPAVTWDDVRHVQDVLRDDKEAIVHLHGHYQKPSSVVLGVRSYDALLSNETAQALQHGFSMAKTLVFVGIGDGLSDPNFSTLRNWLYRTQQRNRHRHYWLVTHEEHARVQNQHPEHERVFILPYGRSHTELPKFIDGLRARPRRASVTAPGQLAFTVEGQETVTRANASEVSIDAWQAAFWTLYGHKDDKLPLYDMMLQMIVDATRLTEAMRKSRYDEAFTCLPRVFSWLCSMSAKCAANPDEYADLSPVSQTLSEIIWHKYPGVCSLCAQKRCVCPTFNADLLTDGERDEMVRSRATTLEAERQLGVRPTTLDEWVGMFELIYGTVNGSRNAEVKVMHFWEELGELEVELRKADRKKYGAVPPGQESSHAAISWEDELADVFSWLSSVYLHIDSRLRRAQVLLKFDNSASAPEMRAAAEDGDLVRPLTSWVWQAYGNPDTGVGLKCHRCHQERCDCNIGFRRR